MVRRAKADGVSVLFLTDHDSVSGLGEAAAEGAASGVEVRGGVEINTSMSDQVHMLGYGLRQGGVLSRRLEEFRARRVLRIQKVVENLRRLGLDVSFEEVRGVSGETLGRPHVADLLISKGIVRTRREAFDKYLSRGRPGYAEPMGPSPAEALALISECGGFSSLAHPDTVKDPSLIREWAGQGLEGLEVYYAAFKPSTRRRFQDMARSLGLLATGGSDFHGPGTGRDGPLGVEVPDEVFGAFMERLSRCS